jgi:hypothetical protein
MIEEALDNGLTNLNEKLVINLLNQFISIWLMLQLSSNLVCFFFFMQMEHWELHMRNVRALSTINPVL